MKSNNYQYLKEGERVLMSDEVRIGEEWKTVSEVLLATVENMTVSKLAEREMWYRRNLPQTGDVQFLMCVSVLVPVIVNCDGKEQEVIEAEAGELAYQKVLDDPRKYINYESIDWAACKVDEIQPEPKNPGKYRMLGAGEVIMAGDQMKDREGDT